MVGRGTIFTSADTKKKPPERVVPYLGRENSQFTFPRNSSCISEENCFLKKTRRRGEADHILKEEKAASSRFDQEKTTFLRTNRERAGEKRESPWFNAEADGGSSLDSFCDGSRTLIWLITWKEEGGRS